MSLVDRDWSNNAGWNWTYPVVDLQFDSRTANLTLDGYAAGLPYRISYTEGGQNVQSGPDEVQGKIKISYLGSSIPTTRISWSIPARRQPGSERWDLETIP